jgi:hypothetical protein
MIVANWPAALRGCWSFLRFGAGYIHMIINIVPQPQTLPIYICSGNDVAGDNNEKPHSIRLIAGYGIFAA